MLDWHISDQDIEATEELLLPHGAHFPEDARKVIRCWHSADVAACPGSGKTTVLIAILKLLADRIGHTHFGSSVVKQCLFILFT